MLDHNSAQGPQKNIKHKAKRSHDAAKALCLCNVGFFDFFMVACPLCF
jgi:hypothetical protein